MKKLKEKKLHSFKLCKERPDLCKKWGCKCLCHGVKQIKKESSFQNLHRFIRRYKPEPELCEICQLKPPYDLANISGNYFRGLDDWRYLCRICHMLSDGRLNMLHKKNIKNMGIRKCLICGSKDTLIRKKNGRPLWYFYNELPNKFVCHKCYMKSICHNITWSQVKKKILKDLKKELGK